MSKEFITLEERQRIRDTRNATRERRKTQVIKVFELKVNCHHTSKETFETLNSYFKQAKWIYNDMLAYSETQDIFDYKYTEHREVSRFDKDKNKIIEKLDIPSVYHRRLIVQLKTNITNLSKAKKKGKKIGKLKYVSEIKSIPIITGYTKIKNKRHITIPGFKNLTVYGLEQLNKYQKYELAEGRLIKRPDGYFVKIAVCIDKDALESKKTYKEVGLDFGVKISVTTSDGKKFDCNVRESEQLKYLQKHLHRKQKGSKRYYKLLKQIRCEYQHLTNKRNDACNKIISYLKSNYDIIYFQDEMVKAWHKGKHSKKTGRKCGYSMGKKIQHSILGRLKTQLQMLQSEGKAFMISKNLPTTKFCPNCGNLNQLTLADRVYTCSCGYSEDRDIHAAKNIKMFGSTKRAECLEQASAETSSSTSQSLNRDLLCK